MPRVSGQTGRLIRHRFQQQQDADRSTLAFAAWSPKPSLVSQKNQRSEKIAAPVREASDDVSLIRLYGHPARVQIV